MADVKIAEDRKGIFVVVDGVKIARRGNPDTPEAGTWVPIEPGWKVVDHESLDTVAIRHDGANVH